MSLKVDIKKMKITKKNTIFWNKLKFSKNFIFYPLQFFILNNKYNKNAKTRKTYRNFSYSEIKEKFIPI